MCILHHLGIVKINHIGATGDTSPQAGFVIDGFSDAGLCRHLSSPSRAAKLSQVTPLWHGGSHLPPHLKTYWQGFQRKHIRGCFLLPSSKTIVSLRRHRETIDLLLVAFHKFGLWPSSTLVILVPATFWYFLDRGWFSLIRHGKQAGVCWRPVTGTVTFEACVGFPQNMSQAGWRITCQVRVSRF